MKLTSSSRVDMSIIKEIYDDSVERGIYIDLDLAEKITEELMDKYEGHADKAIDELPEDMEGINLNSPKQVKEVMTEVYDFEKYASKTKTGNLSFGEDVLQTIYEKTGNLFAYHLREYRSWKSITSKIKEVVDATDESSRVYPQYSFAETNRVSYKKPGLSNLHEACRPIIAAGEGRKLIKADYKAQEVYIQVNMLGIPELQKVFDEYEDFYTGMVKVLADYDLTKNMSYRDNIKTAWLAGIYNSSLSKLGDNKEEKELIKLIKDKVHEIPQIEAYREYVKTEMVEGNNPIVSYFGTERELPIWIKNKYQKQNIAFNNVFQITGADILFFAIERCNNKFKELEKEGKLNKDDIYIYMTIHDEIIFNAKEEIISDELLEIIRGEMILDIEGWNKIRVQIDVTDTY